MKELSREAMETLGIRFSGSLMDNGEYRFRLMAGEQFSSTGYIMTRMPDDIVGAWQKSHSHRKLTETYIVQEGWIGYASHSRFGSEPELIVYRPGQVFTVPPGLVHNVFMMPGSLIHTVKHGDCSLEKDWWPSATLDELLVGIGEKELILRGKVI